MLSRPLRTSLFSQRSAESGQVRTGQLMHKSLKHWKENILSESFHRRNTTLPVPPQPRQKPHLLLQRSGCSAGQRRTWISSTGGHPGSPHVEGDIPGPVGLQEGSAPPADHFGLSGRGQEEDPSGPFKEPAQWVANPNPNPNPLESMRRNH